jgi:hypothetical protein
MAVDRGFVGFESRCTSSTLLNEVDFDERFVFFRRVDVDEIKIFRNAILPLAHGAPIERSDSYPAYGESLRVLKSISAIAQNSIGS